MLGPIECPCQRPAASAQVGGNGNHIYGHAWVALGACQFENGTFQAIHSADCEVNHKTNFS